MPLANFGVSINTPGVSVIVAGRAATHTDVQPMTPL
jgi:hypothetical protein